MNINNLILAAAGDGVKGLIITIVAVLVIIIILFKTARVVPQRQAFVVERLGKYRKTLEAGFHILVPFFDRVAYKHSLKEVAVDVPSQMCITKDNIAEGEKQDAIKRSEAKKLSQINEAEGKAREIELLATATADGIRQIAGAIQSPGGQAAVNLRIAEQYVKEFGNLAKQGNTLIVPQNLSDVGGTVASLAKILEGSKSQGSGSKSGSGTVSGGPPPPLG